MKTATRMFMLLLVMFFFTSQAFSQATPATTAKEVKKENTVASTQGKFVDENKNGVCDNYEARHKDGKNCPNYSDCCKGKTNTGCCGKSNLNCQGTCKGQAKGNCGNGQGNGNGCQYRHGQCKSSSSSATPSAGKPESK